MAKASKFCCVLCVTSTLFQFGFLLNFGVQVAESWLIVEARKNVTGQNDNFVVINTTRKDRRKENGKCKFISCVHVGKQGCISARSEC